MSRQLPARPSLEHLKKQAKQRLDEQQRVNPSAQLADAQHALARDYGFASWPKLKAHVESLSLDRPDVRSVLSGRWMANVAKSARHPANLFQQATIVFDMDGAEVRITDLVVDASGREEVRVNTIVVDGQEHASGSGNGYSLVATWRGPRVLETVARKDGQAVGSATYTVSADGRTLTITSDQQTIVLDRAAPVLSA
jgi:hypothetical protein